MDNRPNECGSLMIWELDFKDIGKENHKCDTHECVSHMIWMSIKLTIRYWSSNGS